MQIVTNFDEMQLGLESTLEDLPLWQIHSELDSPGENLINLFEQEPLMPGIILTKSQNYVGMISRRIFFEFMSRRYSLGLFSDKPIANLFNFLQPETFLISEETAITTATQMALQRSSQLAYEPIVVESKSGRYGIIDFQQLLLASSQIHFLTLGNLQKAEEQSRIAEIALKEFHENYMQLIQNGKMAVLGQFAASIFHEINTPVNWIAGNFIQLNRYIQELLKLINLYQTHYSTPVAEIKTAINQTQLNALTVETPKLLASMKERSKSIQQFIRSFSNNSLFEEFKKRTVDIHECIDIVLLIVQNRLIFHSKNDKIIIVKEYGELPKIECYPGKINQVFFNIFSHTIDTLQESFFIRDTLGEAEKSLSGSSTKKKGQISICTEIIDDSQVVIRIADNGPGMKEDIRERIFYPLRISTSVGKVTGMGLSISDQIIVEQHGGKLECISVAGKGTEFIITIPVNSRFKDNNSI
jgi:signal transduction histidine kinase